MGASNSDVIIVMPNPTTFHQQFNSCAIEPRRQLTKELEVGKGNL
jgi:hypothetical protein